jgi:hypothetical protein
MFALGDKADIMEHTAKSENDAPWASGWDIGGARCGACRKPEAVIFMGWNAGAGTKLDRLRAIVAAMITEAK